MTYYWEILQMNNLDACGHHVSMSYDRYVMSEVCFHSDLPTYPRKWVVLVHQVRPAKMYICQQLLEFMIAVCVGSGTACLLT